LKHPAFRYLKYALFLGITVLLLWLVFPSSDEREEFWNALKQANFWWVLVSLGIILVSHVGRAIRWQMLIAPTGSTPRFSTTFGAVLIGYFANLLFPRLGEVSKCGIINRYERIPVDKLVGTMITERALDLLTLFLLTGLILAVEFQRFGDFFGTQIASPIGEKLEENQWLLIILLAALALAITVVILFYSRLMRFGLFVKTKGFAKGVWDGIKSISRVRNLPVLIFHSLFIWACYYFATWTCFFAMSATAGLGASAALAVLVFGSYGMAAPVQGGLGAFHIMAIASLEAYGVSTTDSTGFAFLIHESQLAVVMVAGSVALVVLPFLNRKTKDVEPAATEPQGTS